MIQLANILHQKGFNITIIHIKYNCPNLSNYPHFTLHLIPDGLSETDVSTLEFVFLFKLLDDKCVKPFRDCLAQSLSDDPIECIVTDAVCSATSSRRGLPLYERFRNGRTSFGVPTLKVKDIPTIETHDPEEAYQAIENWVEETKKASGLIFYTFNELEEPLWTQDRTSISWLDTQYVSFGSVAEMHEEKLNEVAWGLANSVQPFLWVVRPGLVHGSEWLEILSKEV
ncbi:unnamed protein product [Fraxinus pennsylvanica]|uniref:UDP-glycosyltransferase n=1 Tax=Fraxinus pennsylvanica TaxID=56036 RepID=A0AAD2E3L2_9LAMI|nr:unnamed protein product [Fraxinus pennsylvanica]